MEVSNIINNPSFYCKNKDTYPPFKNGLYLEEYFFNNFKLGKNKSGRLYIPALWTNFQIESWFEKKKEEMQRSLDEWVTKNPSDNGYFVVVQHDDGPKLKLPTNTIIYGACSGNIPLPLIYEDIQNKLESIPKKSFKEKTILCSFVGAKTHPIRNKITLLFNNNPNFSINQHRRWTACVNKEKQDIFINATVNSKFALAPRGYGRSSFRFFEIFKLGTIPIYVWDDSEWLPYKDILDYSKFCISIHINQIKNLESILNSINEEKYNTMLLEYNKIKHCFDLKYLVEYLSNK